MKLTEQQIAEAVERATRPQAHPVALGLDILTLAEDLREAVKALEEIACFDDQGGTAHLAATGSYGRFDEPASVKIARQALAGRGEVGK